MGERIRSFDWGKTSLGSPERWDESLKSAAYLMLANRYPMFIWWGDEYINLYNDAYIPVLGKRHPSALGASAPTVWADVWSAVGPQAEAVMRRGESTWNDRVILIMDRNGYTEETYFTFSYSPVRNDAGKVGGVLCVCNEETERVLGERRLDVLRHLGSATSRTRSAKSVCEHAAAAIAEHPYDVPFCLIYLPSTLDPSRAELVAASGIPAESALAPTEVQVGADGDVLWPFEQAAGAPMRVIRSLRSRVHFSTNPWPEPLDTAAVIPLAGSPDAEPMGFMVVGASPRREFDESYQDFFCLLGRTMGSALANARAFEDERRRAQELAELDRAKSTFFSNVSHEFRTPLTLMLGPLEEILECRDVLLPSPVSEQLSIAHRNGLRLLKLVNNLLDFTRLGSGGMSAIYQPTDLGTFTAELADAFRSAVERGGVKLLVSCEPLSTPAYVDRDMWERVVLNLLSNAFKFTLKGEIRVSVREQGDTAELVVSDTGVGVPPHALPHLFERFYRVEDAKGRSFEGTGIGLALVQELVRMHGGSVQVESEVGEGTSFKVTIPLGATHLPSERISASRADEQSKQRARGYVEEALVWALEDAAQEVSSLTSEIPRSPIDASSATILVVDDNEDMRCHIARLLRPRYRVLAAPDGTRALEMMQRERPDLVLSDVMMPGLNGLGLLRAIREQPATHDLPVILLSARGGAEPKAEGLEGGADDYIVKPFSAHELLSRIGTQLRMARVQRDAFLREAKLRRAAEKLSARLERVLASISDQFMVLDSEWRFTYVNERVLEATGKVREELIGKSVWELCPDLIGTDVERAAHTAARERRTAGVEFQVPHSDEWFHLSFYPSLEGLSVLASNITERKRVESLERESQALFRELANAVPVLIWLNDEQADPQFLNAEFFRFTGRSIEELCNGAWIDLVHPEDREEYVAKYIAVAERRALFDAEVRLRRRDGVYRWMRTIAVPRYEQGRFRGYIGSTSDIDAQKQVEQALRESETRFREMADAAPAMLWMSGPHGVSSFLSRGWYEFTGQSKESATGFGWLAAVHPDERETARAEFLKANLERRSFRLEHRLRRYDGEYRWVIDAGRPRLGPNGEFLGFIGSVIDVHERKHAEARSEFLVRLDDALRPLSDPNEITETAARMLGQHLRVNRCAYADVEDDEDTFNLTGDYTEGAPSIVGRYTFAQFGATAAELMRAGEPFVVEDSARDERCTPSIEVYEKLKLRAVICVPLHKGGRFAAAMAGHSLEPRRWRTDEVELVRSVASRCWESIERARLTRTLQQSEERFRTLADNMSQLAWVADEKGATIWYNKRWYEYTGTAFEEVQGWGWSKVHHPDHVDRVMASIKSAWEKGEPWEETFPLLGADGQYRWFLSRALPIRDEQGHVVRWLGTHTDITERRAMEQELARHRDELEKLVEERTRELWASHDRLRMSERMAALGTLSAGLGHDMGNLLVPIRVRLETLAEAELSEDAREDLGAIRRSVEYLQRLANGLRLLALDPQRTSRRERTELQAWWSEASAVLNSVLPSGVMFEWQLPRATCAVAMSKPALSQAVFNLVQNAGDALREQGGGKVRVEARCRGGMVELEVSDNGPGMTDEVRARCMEPFFTTKTRGISTGLGLALVYGLVQEVGGHVELHSEIGKGTTFVLYLPIAVREKRAAAAGERIRSAMVDVADARTRSFIIGQLRSLEVELLSHDDSPDRVDLVIVDAPKKLADAPDAMQTVLLAEQTPKRGVLAIGSRPTFSTLREVLRTLAVSEIDDISEPPSRYGMH